ncbi:MAG: rhodanese-like domain-containing protein [Deltaproteobacteria bacterium]|nr:rhodanese-like domain-containing protein [Deltaproteobacteria bacterium]
MEAPRIRKEEFKKKLDKNEVIVLDVRNSFDYNASDKKIPGAVRIPLQDLELRIKELDPAKEIVAYCT